MSPAQPRAIHSLKRRRRGYVSARAMPQRSKPNWQADDLTDPDVSKFSWSVVHQIREAKSVALDDLAVRGADARAKHRSVDHACVELAVFTAWIDVGRQLVE